MNEDEEIFIEVAVNFFDNLLTAADRLDVDKVLSYIKTRVFQETRTTFLNLIKHMKSD